jgi:hypothetical protein
MVGKRLLLALSWPGLTVEVDNGWSQPRIFAPSHSIEALERTA